MSKLTGRWRELDGVTSKVLAVTKNIIFKTAYQQTLYNFADRQIPCRRVIDIIKDRLYIYAPKSLERRPGATALYQIAGKSLPSARAGSRFTTDEGKYAALKTRIGSSAEFPKMSGATPILLADWERIFSIRDEVLKSLEEAGETRKSSGRVWRRKPSFDGRGDDAIFNRLLRRFALLYRVASRSSRRVIESKSKKGGRRNANAAGIIRQESANGTYPTVLRKMRRRRFVGNRTSLRSKL